MVPSTRVVWVAMEDHGETIKITRIRLKVWFHGECLLRTQKALDLIDNTRQKPRVGIREGPEMLQWLGNELFFFFTDLSLKTKFIKKKVHILSSISDR